jgi:N-formylglutamate deformylase
MITMSCFNPPGDIISTHMPLLAPMHTQAVEGSAYAHDFDKALDRFDAQICGLDEVGAAPFLPVRIARPAVKQQSPVIISCPHSGRIYPAEFLATCAVDLADLRGLEDFATDQLVIDLPSHGVTTLTNAMARAYIDVNRPIDALDPAMFSAPPSRATAPSSRLVRAGYGLLPRLTAERQTIHRVALAPEEVDRRITRVYTPYHQHLATLLDRAEASFGTSLLIDIHSMPSNDQNGRPLADIILGDIHHNSLDRLMGQRLSDCITEKGFSLIWNSPYAGGFITKHYGHAASRRQSVQIEINRRLYMEDGLQLIPEGVIRIRALLAEIAAALCPLMTESQTKDSK